MRGYLRTPQDRLASASGETLQRIRGQQLYVVSRRRWREHNTKCLPPSPIRGSGCVLSPDFACTPASSKPKACTQECTRAIACTPRKTPPPAEIPTALGELERYIHGATKLPPLLEIALVHYQFEAIHPFLDGNGRIGRLLITLITENWD